MSAEARADSTPTRTAGSASYSAARLAAVQALYQIALSGESMSVVLEEFLRHRLGDSLDEAESVKPKAALFTEIVRGASRRRSEIDEMLAAVLTESWPIDRLETVLRCILEAGVFELLARSQAPARVVITEYVDLAHAFYAGPEPGMVNGILDRLARTLRPGEFGDAEGD